MREGAFIMLRTANLTALVLTGLLAFAPGAAAQGVGNFTLTVPVRSPGAGADGTANTDDDVLPISKVDLRTTVSTVGNVAFNITNPHGQMLRFPEVGTITIGSAAVNRTFSFVPAGAAAGDTVVVTPPSGALAATDPARFVYSINISTNSDYHSSSCAVLMGGPENWTIAIEGTDTINGVCAIAFDKAFPNFQCQVNHKILATNGGPLPTVAAFPPGSVQQCATDRPALDAILVLDRSGSMASKAVATSPSTKIVGLRQAVKDFVNVWVGLRAAETSPPADRIGLVFFDTAVLWASQLGIAAWAGLTQGVDELDKLVGGIAVKDLIVNNIDSVTTANMTALGGGLVAADGKFGAGTGTNRKVVLLMSNGLQNQDPRVKVDNAVNPPQVVQFNLATPMTTAPLTNQANYQIYSVTVGPSTAVSGAINQDVAAARGGFYINSEDNGDLVRPFFLELLQNFLHFNSYEVVRMVSGTVTATPLTTTFPVPAAARVAAVTIQFPSGRTALRLRVTPPGAPAREVVSQNGFGVIRFDLPLTPVTNPNSDWQIEVAAITDGNPGTIPVDVTVISDDLAIDSEMTATGADFVPGQPVRLRAKITEFGLPVTNIGGSGGGRVIAQLVRPGTTIGDLLSNNAAGPTQPTGDPGTAADAKLATLMEQNPGLLQRVADTVTLLDNGNAANGDETANDGIYSAVYTPAEPGHYNFLYGIEGVATTAKFSRQQLKTVYIRAEPNANQSQFQTSTQDNQLVILATPRTLSGSRMGPGYANYIWFTAPGIQPVKPVDNLDGTYRVTLGTTAGPVSMHFLDLVMQIGDSVTPDQLPGGGLGPATVVVAEIPGSTAKSRLWLWIVLLLILLLILALYLYKRAHP
jgi:hypothetical protein